MPHQQLLRSNTAETMTQFWDCCGILFTTMFSESTAYLRAYNKLPQDRQACTALKRKKKLNWSENNEW